MHYLLKLADDFTNQTSSSMFDQVLYLIEELCPFLNETPTSAVIDALKNVMSHVEIYNILKQAEKAGLIQLYDEKDEKTGRIRPMISINRKYMQAYEQTNNSKMDTVQLNIENVNDELIDQIKTIRLNTPPNG